MTRIVLTPSQIESYLECPWRMYLNLCKLQTPPQFGVELGAACHEFIRGLHSPKYSFDGVVTDANPRFSKDHINHEWYSFWTNWLRKSKKVMSNDELSEFMIKGIEAGPSYIRKYLSINRALEIDVDKIEVQFPTTHIPETCVDLNARVDQIRPHPKKPEDDILIDLKFTEHNEHNPYANLALKCYALIYRIRYLKPEANVCIWNVPFEKEGVHKAVFTNEDMESTRNTIRKVGLRISKRMFNVPDGKPICEKCSQKEICTNPSTSIELRKLAYQNTHHKGFLPKSRLAIIRERVLELKDGKPLEIPNTQVELGI